MKMKKMNLKTIMLTSIITLGMLVIGTTNSNAALQANPTTYNNPKKIEGDGRDYFIKAIREMEAPNQTMGLTEEIDETTLVETTNNNIDVHMMKSTELGAIAILTLSGFGNPQKIPDSQIKSSTGNVTGVYYSDRGRTTVEQTACIGVNELDRVMSANSRYYVDYRGSKTGAVWVPHVGDGYSTDDFKSNFGIFTVNEEDFDLYIWSCWLGSGSRAGIDIACSPTFGSHMIYGSALGCGDVDYSFSRGVAVSGI